MRFGSRNPSTWGFAHELGQSRGSTVEDELKYPEQVRPYIYTTNQLERINKEIKRRTKTIEVFSSEESLISVLYLILRSENDKLSCRRLRGFRNLGWEEEG
ncbi:MAG: transposase [Actinomycetota bacterium]|nr:transposase [Actinomycetota bacterium]